MSATLSSLTDRVEQVLVDTGNKIWDIIWIAEGMRQALHEYSQAKPLQAITTLAVTADSYELDISSIAGLLNIMQVWTPYTVANPENPPNIRTFEHWVDNKILYLPNYQLQNGDTARIFYTKLHTINGLDTETITSVQLDDETMLVNGAAGYVAASRAIDLTEQVTIDRLTAQQVRAWGLSKLQEFRSALRRAARESAANSSPIVIMPPLDRWDGSITSWRSGTTRGWS